MMPAALDAKTAVAAPAQVRSKLDAFIDDQKVQERLSYLYARWSDERSYEDFADYEAEIRKVAEAAGLSFVRATRRPFGAVVEIEGFRYQVGLNATSIYFKRA